jgi:hypothetical protein
MNITLEPGEEYEYQESKRLSVGDYFAEPVVKINGEWGGEIRNANRVYFTVRVPSPDATPTLPPPLSTKPAGKADHLVVLVHGCCTDANEVRDEWYPFGRLIAERIVRKSDWEIVVWDWHKDEKGGVQTPKPTLLTPKQVAKAADKAYEAADVEGRELAQAINQADINNQKKYKNNEHNYTYIHFIAHSAGANLIDQAAKQLAEMKRQRNMEEPFIHLTFLDAYTPPKGAEESKSAKDRYGSLPNDYLKHYSEHYVDKGLVRTDESLPNAFNFDITDWKGAGKGDFLLFGHWWPVRWYIQSITEIDNETPRPGLPLSREGGNNGYAQLSTRFQPGGTCSIIDEVTWSISWLLCGQKNR